MFDHELEAETRRLRGDVDALMRILGHHKEIEGVVREAPGLNKRVVMLGSLLGMEADESAFDSHPFFIDIGRDANDVLGWRVLSNGSSITDGTNGQPIDLSAAGFDEYNALLGGNTYIYLSATKEGEAEDFTKWEIKSAQNSTDIKEVVVDDDSVQTEANLFIGHISFNANAQVGTKTQATKSAQLFDYGFLNGLLVKIFIPHTVNPDSIQVA